MIADKKEIESQINQVRKTMASLLDDSQLARFIPMNKNVLGSGKMLRSKLVQYLGLANHVDSQTLVHAGAAVDIIHAASLVHDDVIDGGLIRRGAPTFWHKHGTNGAILFGDLLMFRALALLTKSSRSDLLEELINMTGEVCRSEVEQELILRGEAGNWEECVQIARFKTGSLFAFAAVAGNGGDREEIAALREAGFKLGTAYQLADDILDASGNEAVSGKTLGRDAQRGKTTAMTIREGSPDNPVSYLKELLEQAENLLTPWASTHQAWRQYVEEQIDPVIKKFIQA
jgi:geranylgeranyl pyrophosphate synthase